MTVFIVGVPWLPILGRNIVVWVGSLVVVKSIDFITSLLRFKSKPVPVTHSVTLRKWLNLSGLQFLLLETREGNDDINYVIPQI